MTHTIKGLAAVVAVFFVAGCSDVTAPLTADDVAASYSHGGEFTFNTTTSSEGGQAFAATGGTGSVSFQGSMETPNPCYEVTGSHRVSGSKITLTVSAASTGGFCIQVITWFNYDGGLSGLSAGTYTFEIVHRNSGEPAETVYTTEVAVS